MSQGSLSTKFWGHFSSDIVWGPAVLYSVGVMSTAVEDGVWLPAMGIQTVLSSVHAWNWWQRRDEYYLRKRACQSCQLLLLTYGKMRRKFEVCFSRSVQKCFCCCGWEAYCKMSDTLYKECNEWINMRWESLVPSMMHWAALPMSCWTSCTTSALTITFTVRMINGRSLTTKGNREQTFLYRCGSFRSLSHLSRKLSVQNLQVNELSTFTRRVST